MKMTIQTCDETAHRQWASRSPDERFPSIEVMDAKAREYRDEGREAAIASSRRLADMLGVGNMVSPRGDLGGEVQLIGRTGKRARITSHAFGQIAREAAAPAGYLQTLPADLAVDCLRTGLAGAPDRERRLLFRQNGETTLRGLTSDSYSRIWNADVTERLVELKRRGPWQEAPAAFDGSRGQYMGEKDMFSFFVDSDRRIFESDPNGGLSRGFYARNSEVGFASLDVMLFLYEHVCGNHRVWGFEKIAEISLRHVGNVDERWVDAVSGAVRVFAESSAADDEARIRAAREFELGGTKEEVLDRIFGLGLASRKNLELGFARAVEHEDWYGNPRSAWGLSGGLTEVARDLPNADERLALDRAGARIVELAVA